LLEEREMAMPHYKLAPPLRNSHYLDLHIANAGCQSARKPVPERWPYGIVVGLPLFIVVVAGILA
jgi:hypothetical protein